MIAVVIGSTGVTGSQLVRDLVLDSTITSVISVSRRALALTDAKLTQVLVPDLRELPSLAPTLGGDLYFCCLGTTMKTAGSKANFERVDHDAVMDFARIASAHHATSLAVVSATGASARSMIFYNAVKGRTEDDLMALGLRSLLIFRPALLVGRREEVRRGERVLIKTLVPLSNLLPARWRRRLVTRVDRLAAHMLAAAKAAPPGTQIIHAQDI